MKIETVFKRAWRPPDRRTPWEWCEDHIIVDKTSPFPGKWKSSTSPWVKEPMEFFPNNQIRDMVIICSAQSSKTQTAMNLTSWAIAEDPGPMMWVMAAQDEAKTFARNRLVPTYENCEPVKALFPQNRHHKKTLEINFPSMPLIINGANSFSKLQEKPIRWLLLDEVRNYPPGALETVMKRIRAFWNGRRLIISTPNVKNDALHRLFLEGDQRYYHVSCMRCGNRAPLKWANMKWDKNEVTQPGGIWNFTELAKTVRYECPDCKHELKDRGDIRKALAQSGIWIPNNKNAAPEKKSWTWNAILPPWVKWVDLIQEFISATTAAKLGDIQPLKTFVTESLGEPFDEMEQEVIEPDDRPESDYTIEEIEQGFGDFQFFTVDVQQKEFWGGIRGWMKTGESKLITLGNYLSWGEIRDVQEKFKIKDKYVFVDSGYDTAKVYAKCCQFGWTALKGEDKPYFSHHLTGGKSVRKLYSPLTRGDPGIGTVAQGQRYAKLILWSNPWAWDILERLKSGNGAPWEIPKNVPIWYLKQMASTIKKDAIDPKTQREIKKWKTISKNNHSWDWEAMQVAAASMAGIISTSAPPEETPEQI